MNSTDHPAYRKYKYVVPLPNEELMHYVGAKTVENFFLAGEARFHVLSRFLPHPARVLDIGCGCGRTARYLCTVPDLEYIGFDLSSAAIEWCRNAFGPIHGAKLRFEHFDGYSGEYNPEGGIKASEYRFPCEDTSIDMAFANSVFTHLLENDALHYLSEMARVLKNDGQALVTFHNAPPDGKSFHGSEARIDIETSYFRKMAEKNRLEWREEIGDIAGQSTVRLVRST